MSDRTQRPGSESEQWRPTSHQIVAGLVGLVVLVFALVNLEDASIDFVFADVTLPLFFVIVGAALVGGIAGYFLRARHHKDD